MFNVGDRVVCIRNSGKYLLKNECYTVKRFFTKNHNNFVDVVDDSGNDYGGWFADRFQLVTKTEWIVSSSYPKKYDRLITLPDGQFCYTMPQPVIEKVETINQFNFLMNANQRCINNFGYGGQKAKGQMRDGKPFGQWTIDFGE